MKMKRYVAVNMRAALAAVRKVLSANDGKPEKVDAVLFTTFVMQ